MAFTNGRLYGGVFWTILVLVVCAIVASTLRRIAQVEPFRAGMASFAPVAGDLFMVAFGVAMVFTVVSYWWLQRFVRSVGAD